MLKKINTKFEELLNTPNPSAICTEISNIDSPAEQTHPETQFCLLKETNANSLENLSYIFSNEINQDNLSNLFSQIACHFEIGLLLKKNNPLNTHKLIEVFVFSQKNEISVNTNEIKLPDIPVFTILRTTAQNILKHFEMNDLDVEQKMTSYLIPLTYNYSIIIITQTAEPWVRLKIESLQKTLMKINFIL